MIELNPSHKMLLSLLLLKIPIEINPSTTKLFDYSIKEDGLQRIWI